MKVTDSQNVISLEFAKTLLRVLYRLDDPLDELGCICADLSDGEEKTQFSNALGEIQRLVLTELMVPIYRQHPELGRASEPGDWLYQKDESK